MSLVPSAAPRGSRSGIVRCERARQADLRAFRQAGSQVARQLTMQRICAAAVLWAACCRTGVAQTDAERLIEAGHWKRARALVEARMKEAPEDPLCFFLLSQIRNAFGDRATPLSLAERAVTLDPKVAKFHRQLAEALGVTAEHAGMLQQFFLARRFRHEIDSALTLDPKDVQALRDLLEFYLLAPGVAGGDAKKAAGMADRIAALDAVQGFLAHARIAEFQKEPSDAERFTRLAVDADPRSYRARIALAELCLAKSRPDFECVETQAHAARETDAERADAWGLLAEVLASRSDWKALDSLLRQASERVPDDLSPYYRAAVRLLDERRALERAARYLRLYLGQPPEGNRPTSAEAMRKLKVAAPVTQQAGK